jgi:ribosomal protein S18 acetylase RimI-like enzyme
MPFAKCGVETVLKIRTVKISDVDSCFAIETQCFGAMGAPRRRILKRATLFPHGFLVAELETAVVGFINSGATNDDGVGDENFKDLFGHDPSGGNLVVFSLTVHPRHRAKGYSTQLMSKFIANARTMEKKAIFLVCQKNLIDYYVKFGYEYSKLSPLVYGGQTWHEMKFTL